MDEIELGIDEGAVQIENQCADGREARGGGMHVNILKHERKKLLL